MPAPPPPRPGSPATVQPTGSPTRSVRSIRPCTRSACQSARGRRHLQEGLPHRRSRVIQVDDARYPRVHPPLPDACLTARLPPYPLLRLAHEPPPPQEYDASPRHTWHTYRYVGSCPTAPPLASRRRIVAQSQPKNAKSRRSKRPLLDRASTYVPPTWQNGSSRRFASSQAHLSSWPNPHSTRGTAAAHIPRFRALANFGRRPSERVDGPAIPASENLHSSRSTRRSRPSK